LTKSIPSGYPQLDPGKYCYINAHAGDLGEILDSVVDQVLDRLFQSIPRLGSRCRRRHLLRTWNKPASALVAPPFCQGNAQYDSNPELHEVNLALAAAIGFTEKLARAMRVIQCLMQLAKECDEARFARRQVNIRNVRARARELFSLFRTRPG